MPTPGRPTSRTLVLTIATALAFSGLSRAQDIVLTDTQSKQTFQGNEQEQALLTPEQKARAADFYRAEFVIIERRIEPGEVEERMSGRLPEPPDLEISRVLRHTNEAGKALTNLELVPQKELHLQSAAQRLERSGRYRILLAEGWYQAFPPDFIGEPMWVTAGDWLEDAGHSDVQGTITIDRQRYLHVKIQLNHWVPDASTGNLLGIDLNAETPSRPHPPRIAIEPTGLPAPAGDDIETNIGVVTDTAAATNPQLTEEKPKQTLIAGLNWPRADLLTWIQETRRMRSEEVHFLDSPTLGVLIFFKKIEPEEAAPLILELDRKASQQASEEQRFQQQVEIIETPEAP